MRSWTAVLATVVAGVALASGIALGQPKSDECTPHRIGGRIVRIDWKEGQEQGKLLVQGSEGRTYEFNASREALADKKVGDHIEVTKRLPAGCKS